MKITIVGSGCPSCEKLHQMVKELKAKGKISGEIEYLKGVNELVKRGIMGSPAILVDDKLVFTGKPSEEELLKLLKGK